MLTHHLDAEDDCDPYSIYEATNQICTISVAFFLASTIEFNVVDIDLKRQCVLQYRMSEFDVSRWKKHPVIHCNGGAIRLDKVCPFMSGYGLLRKV